ncbi:dTDP-4-dehydrorhamnose 3,5-epimerase [Virgifigura deserti]|uniref:dTDP-4-dehydrorhamnose 3,5-epimerase n=1 Tax=Virgifigura deserti TaxID=2268457 RepID=UPI003CCB83B1
MKVIGTAIPDIKLIQPVRHGDTRGFLSETYNKRMLAASGITVDFVQDNHSLSAASGTVRGLHFQSPPFAQTKLVRVTRGAIYDVAVDLRAGSPTFGRHVAAILSAEDWNQLLIPVGFAHGFCTLTAEAEVLYKVDQYYSRDNDLGLLWNDPDLAIDWPVEEASAILSEKDRRLPRLRDLPTWFR